MSKQKRVNKLVTNCREGTLIRSDGPVGIYIQSINNFGQVELVLLVPKEVRIEKIPNAKIGDNDERP